MAKHITLIGMMGSGKSTVAPLIAPPLKRAVIEVDKLIEEQETEREGNRPERTIYRLTDAGRFELMDWLSELVCHPVKEYTQFEAGLCLLPVLPPGQAIDLLKERCDALAIEIDRLLTPSPEDSEPYSRRLARALAQSLVDQLADL